MLFRPSFCANCGERIERTDWGIFTSRRFCQVCETEFKGTDLIPRAIVVFGILGALVGFSSYFGSGASPASALSTKPAAKQKDPVTAVNPNLPQPANTTQQPKAADAQSSLAMPRTLASQSPIAPSPQRPVVEESNYYCGAETKKGTPCSRRVKGNTRCFQHKGMPAMLPPDKLKIG